MSRGEAQQSGDLVAIGEILAYTLFQDATELFPKLHELVVFVRRERLEQAQHFLGAACANRLDVLRLLQDLARDIQRQVVRIDDTTHEPQISWQQLLRIIHDEDAADIKLDAVAGVAIPQIERRARREVEQFRVLLATLDAGVGPRERIVEIVPDVLVEFLVLLVADLALGACPQSRRLIHRLVFGEFFRLAVFPLLLLHEDRLGDMVGVSANDRAQLAAGEQVFLALAQVQRD